MVSEITVKQTKHLYIWWDLAPMWVAKPQVVLWAMLRDTHHQRNKIIFYLFLYSDSLRHNPYKKHH